MSTEYRLPPLPLGGPAAKVARWLKQCGDRLAPGDPLLVVLNHRAEIAIPTPHAGTLEAALVPEGAEVTVGAPIARIARTPAAERRTTNDEGQSANIQASQARLRAAPRRISPVARRIASALDIDITNLDGTGPGGRIVKNDLLAAHAGAPETRRPGDQEISGQGPRPTDETQHVPPSSMRRAIAEHMVRSRATSPHALTAMQVDMARVAAARARQRADFARCGVDLTYTACIALAAVEALLRHPLLNSSWSDAGIVVRRRVHLGVAVALPDGLITPVIREAQDLNLRGIARAVGDVASRARAGALRPGEASGGTFTITNPGAGALWFGTPIIAQPQGAILGVGAVRPRPLVVSEHGADRVVVRPTAVLTLAYDARILDQCHADAFLRDVKQTLESFDA